MAIVTGKSQRWRVFTAHAALWVLLAFTLFPLLAVVSISLRPGNFATGSLIPATISFEHWQLALGIPVTQPDGTVVPPPFPVLLWLWNSIKIATISSLLIVAKGFNWPDFVVTFVGCILGITLLAAALSRFMLVEMRRGEQLLCLAAALLLIAPGLMPTLVGAALALPVLWRQVVASRKPVVATAV